MDKFNKTLTILDNLIAKLEANTGGQVSKDKSTKAQKTDNVVNVAPQKQVKQSSKTDTTVQKVQLNKEKKQEKQTKKKQKKQQKKAQKAPAGKVQEAPQQGKKQKKAQKGEKAEKAEKKQKKQQEKKQQGKKQEGRQGGDATVEDFAQIDIRIGQIVQCWKHPQSQKLYCEKINVSGQVREIASGLQQHVPMDQMKGKVIVMANLKPRPLAKFMSNGMVVCASNLQHTDIKLIRPQGQNGERVFLEGHQNLFNGGPILPVLNPKKKILQRCLEHFKTDEQGFITWKGIKAKTSGGYLRSQIKNGNVS